MVLGASGSGKSSVLRAGLVPRSRRDVERWLVVDPLRPENNPAMALAEVLHESLDRVGVVVTPSSLADTIAEAAALMDKPIAAEATSGPKTERRRPWSTSYASRSDSSEEARDSIRFGATCSWRAGTWNSRRRPLRESSPPTGGENPLIERLASLRRANRRDGATIFADPRPVRGTS